VGNGSIGALSRVKPIAEVLADTDGHGDRNHLTWTAFGFSMYFSYGCCRSHLATTSTS
jgi:hypothetical protein